MKRIIPVFVLISALAGFVANGGSPKAGSPIAGSPNGRAGTMPAFYDDELFTINFKEISDKAAASLLAHNTSVNVIYVHDDPLPGGSMFIAVLDAIQGDGFNPLWLEVAVEFTPGHTPHQFHSDTEIDDALDDGEITLHSTGEVYRCSVIGPK